MQANESNWSGMADEWLDAAYGTSIHVSRRDEVIVLSRTNGTSHGSAATGRPSMSVDETAQPRKKLKKAA